MELLEQNHISIRLPIAASVFMSNAHLSDSPRAPPLKHCIVLSSLDRPIVVCGVQKTFNQILVYTSTFPLWLPNGLSFGMAAVVFLGHPQYLGMECVATIIILQNQFYAQNNFPTVHVVAELLLTTTTPRRENGSH